MLVALMSLQPVSLSLCVKVQISAWGYWQHLILRYRVSIFGQKAFVLVLFINLLVALVIKYDPRLTCRFHVPLRVLVAYVHGVHSNMRL